MGRSKGTIISVKVPIRWNHMTESKKIRISRITGRDTRIIKAYLGVIERHEKVLLVGKRQKRIHSGKLDELTLTATRGKSDRTEVLHDFKTRFPNISVNEFQECRDTAIAMWQSYLERGGSKPFRSKQYSSRKIPRYAFVHRFEHVQKPDQEIKNWLLIRDSLDSACESRRIHDKLSIPLSMSSFHLRQMKRGNVKTVRLFKDTHKKWWAIFTVTIDVQKIESVGKPSAVFGIDLGIDKAACTVLLTKSGFKHVQYWYQDDKLQVISKYDENIASLQKMKERLISQRKDSSQVAKRLRILSGKRDRVSKEFDKKLVSDIVSRIIELTKDYDIWIAIGKLRGIRESARRGNLRGKKYRRMIHRWSFARIRNYLEHSLVTKGFNKKRFLAVNEAWTSIICYRCGNKGVRPKQSLFICHTCGFRANADLNGAINIGMRVIRLINSLRDEKNGLGVWLCKSKVIPNTSRSKCSKRESISSSKSSASRRRSVAECESQTSLAMFDNTKDPAMEKTVETPSAIIRTKNVSDANDNKMQRTETWCQQMDHVQMKLEKDYVTSDVSKQKKTGDSGRKKGETQKFLTVHSTHVRDRSS